MRVLHVMPSIDAEYGGPTQALAGFLEAARYAGIDAHVAAPRASRADSDFISRRMVHGGLHEFSTFGSGSSVASPSLWRWLSRAAADFDVVHVHGLFNPLSTFASRVAIARRRALVIRPFGTMARFTATHRRARLKAAYMALLERRNLERASAIHFTSDLEREEAKWHGIDLAKRGIVVPPPYVGAYAKRAPASSGRTVLFLGRLHPVKNLEMLIRAWPEVQALAHGARLVLAGDGDPRYRDALVKLASELGISDAVEFTGFADATAKEQLFSRADVLVLPSVHENFGIVALEAIARGIPVALSRGVQLAPFADRHGVGAVFDLDGSSLARAVGEVLNGAFSQECGAHGADLVRAQYSPEVIGAQLARLYSFAATESV